MARRNALMYGSDNWYMNYFRFVLYIVVFVCLAKLLGAVIISVIQENIIEKRDDLECPPGLPISYFFVKTSLIRLRN